MVKTIGESDDPLAIAAFVRDALVRTFDVTKRLPSRQLHSRRRNRIRALGRTLLVA